MEFPGNGEETRTRSIEADAELARRDRTVEGIFRGIDTCDESEKALSGIGRRIIGRRFRSVWHRTYVQYFSPSPTLYSATFSPVCTAYLCAQHTVCTLERTNRGILVILLIKWNTSTKDVWAIDRTGYVFRSGVGTDNTLIIDASPVHAAIEIRPTTPPCTACLLPSDRNIQNERSEERRRWGGILLPASYKSNISGCASRVIGPSPSWPPIRCPVRVRLFGQGEK